MNSLEQCKDVVAAVSFAGDATGVTADLLDSFILDVPFFLTGLAIDMKKADSSENKQKSLQKIVREYCDKVVQVLEDPSCVPEDHLCTLLRSLNQSGTILFREYPKLRKQLIKSVISIWSSWPSDSVRIVALLTLHHFCSKHSSLLEECRKIMYQHYTRSCRTLGPHNLGQATLMLNGLVEIFALQSASSIKFATKSLRQMASLIQQAIKKPLKENTKKVLCWQFIALMRFWTRLIVVTSASNKNPFRELVFPVTSILCCLLNFQFSPRYFAFDFHLVSCGIELMSKLSIFLPIAPCLLKIIGYVAKQPIYKLESKKAAYDLVALYKVPKSETCTKGYLESVGEDALFYLLQFLTHESAKMTFPEHAQAIVRSLREMTANNLKIDRIFKKQIEGHVSKILQQSKEIENLCIKEAVTPLILVTNDLVVPDASRILLPYVANLEAVRTAKRKMLSERPEEVVDKPIKSAKGKPKAAKMNDLGEPSSTQGTKKESLVRDTPKTSAKTKRPLPASKIRSGKRAKNTVAVSGDQDIVEDFVLND